MKNKKIIVSALVMSMLAGTLFSGCGGKTAQTTKGENKANATTTAAKDSKASDTKKTDANAAKGDYKPASDNPVTFTCFLNFNNIPFNGEWDVWKEVTKKTNVTLKNVIAQSNSDEKQAFQLMLSSGELADVIGFVDMGELEQLGYDGAMIPLDDLIKANAPHIQAMLEKDDAFRRTATAADGKIYFIPRNFENKFAEFYWIRKDWLDKLKLQAPTTVDELYKVLTAFRNNDPNGNGKKDEIPFFDRAGDKNGDEILYLWDSSVQFYPRDGHMVYDPMYKNFKVGMKEAIKWYKEGLIDPEYFTRGAKGRDALMSANVGGFTHDWSSASNYNKSLQAQFPGLEMMAIAPPKDQNGNQVERSVNSPGVGWGISSQAKDPATIMKFFDFLFTEEGQKLMDWGIEGTSYEKKGDKLALKEDFLKKEGTPIGNLRAMGSRYRVGYPSTLEAELSTYTEFARKAAELYQSHPEWYRKDIPNYADGKLELKFTPEENSEFSKIMSDISSYTNEKYQKWVLGTADFDKEYDEYLNELKKRNIDRATEIVDGAYQRFLGKK